MNPRHLIFHLGPLLIRTLVLLPVMLQAGVSLAQVKTEITSSGLKTKVTQVAPRVFEITGGTRSGSNLFHSFGLFNVGADKVGQRDTARFKNTTPMETTKNILSRVTGGQLSNIFGIIDALSYPGANLFLINPAGWIFGPTASLNVGGSFHVSTADKLLLADGNEFLARPDPVKDALLTSSPPVAFGFLGQTSPATITVDRSTLDVLPGNGISIVGGGVKIEGGRVRAPSGQVTIASLLSRGDVPLNGDFNAGSSLRLGQIEIRSKAGTRANINVSANAVDPRRQGRGGTVLIRGGQLVVDNSSLLADTIGDLNGAKAGIDLQAAEDINLANGTLIRTLAARGRGDAGDISMAARNVTIKGKGTSVLNETAGIGNGGRVEIFARSGSVTLSDGGEVRSRTRITGTGKAGDVMVQAGESVLLFGSSSGIFGSSDRTDAAAQGAGDISVSGARITITDGAQIESGGANLQGANVNVAATESIVISNKGGISSQAFSKNVGQVEISAQSLIIDAGFIEAGTIQAGNAGKIKIDTGKVELKRGGQIVNSSALSASGDAGDLTVIATDSISISGKSTNNKPISRFGNDPSSGLFSTASAASKGNAGKIIVSTPKLSMGAGSKISVATAVKAAALPGKERTADISVDVRNLTLKSGSQIESSTTGARKGGNITVAASDSVSISGSGSPPSGLFSTASSTGNAGKVTVLTPTLTMGDGGTISVATTGTMPNAGDAGGILAIGNKVSLTGGARFDSSTSGAGEGGNISIIADTLSIAGGAGLFSNAEGTGTGGNIFILAEGDVNLTGRATISARSTSTQATADAGNISIKADVFRSRNSTVTTEADQAGGGKIELTASRLVHLTDSKMTTSVRGGDENAGNIFIDPQFVILDRSQIRADAFEGAGGNVDIRANVFLTSRSDISASSALGVPGTINIQASITDLSGSLAQLPEAVLQASELLRASCAARLAGGKASSLVLGGREGLPLEPGGLLPSPLFMEGPMGLPSAGQRLAQERPAPRFTILPSSEKGLPSGPAWKHHGFSKAAVNLRCSS